MDPQGFGRLTLSRCVEQPDTYLLLVEWRRLEDHIEGFRGSPQYQEWCRSGTSVISGCETRPLRRSRRSPNLPRFEAYGHAAMRTIS
jgi:heme-degrading monooxygenase HmoA